jgi:hypothetical protein
MSDDVREALSDVAALDLSDAGKLEGSSQWKMRKLIKEGEYESYMDGRKRKVTLRSIKARRDRLLKAQTAPPTIPPIPRCSRSRKPQRTHVAMTP